MICFDFRLVASFSFRGKASFIVFRDLHVLMFDLGEFDFCGLVLFG